MTIKPTIEQILQQLRTFRDERDWKQFHTAKNLAMSISIEAGELLEVFQWTDAVAQPTERDIARAADEAADVFIYLLLLCDELGIDLPASAVAKINRNEERFPPLGTSNVSPAGDAE